MSDGMVSASVWGKTDVHKASTYFCNRCKREFKNPHRFSEHQETCKPVDTEIRLRSRVRLDTAAGIVTKIDNGIVHVLWDTGARCPVPEAWLTKEI